MSQITDLIFPHVSVAYWLPLLGVTPFELNQDL